MPCLKAPVIHVVLPSPWSLEPPVFSVGPFDASLCCKFAIIPAVSTAGLIPGITAPGAVTGFIVTVNGMFAVVEAFLDSLQLDCPFQ